MVGVYGLVSGRALWSDGDCGFVCLCPVRTPRAFRQRCWLTAFSLCVWVTEGFRSVLYLPATISKWLWFILWFRLSFVFLLWVVLRKHVYVDVLASSWWAASSKTCHPFIPFSSCSFCCFHTPALSTPSNFNISITNLCAQSEEIVCFPCILADALCSENLVVGVA